MVLYDHAEVLIALLIILIWVGKLIYDRRCRNCKSKDVRKRVTYGIEWRQRGGEPFSHKLVQTKTIHRICNNCGTPKG